MPPQANSSSLLLAETQSESWGRFEEQHALNPAIAIGAWFAVEIWVPSGTYPYDVRLVASSPGRRTALTVCVSGPGQACFAVARLPHAADRLRVSYGAAEAIQDLKIVVHRGRRRPRGPTPASRFARTVAAGVALVGKGRPGELARRAFARVHTWRCPPFPCFGSSYRKAGTGAPPWRTALFTQSLGLEGRRIIQNKLSRGLRDRGVSDPVVVAPADGPLRERYQAAGIQVILRPEPTRGYPSPTGYLRRIQGLTHALADLRSDLVHANTVRTFFAIEAANCLGVPAVWNLREPNPAFGGLGDLPAYLQERATSAYRAADKVVFVAEATRQDWEDAGYQGATTVIRNCIDVPQLKMPAHRIGKGLRRRLGIAPTELLLLSVGTFCARKGQADLIRVAGALPCDVMARLRFVLLGDEETSYRRNLGELLRRLSPERRQRFSFISAEVSVAEFYAAADIFVLCSRAESYPKVILEAMAFGLPIITTPVGGISEQVEHGESACFYSPGDVQALGRAIEMLASGTDLRRRLGDGAEARLARINDTRSMLGAYEEAITSCVGTASGTRP